MSEYKGIAVGGLVTGIAGSALGLMNNGGLGNLLGGARTTNCGDGAYINRYELGLEQASLAKDSRIALLESTIHTNDKLGELRDYVDRRFTGVEAQLSAQGVINAQLGANLACLQGNVQNLMGLTKLVVPATNICPQPTTTATT